MSGDLLGFLDAPLHSSTSALTSKIGGDPVVYGGDTISLVCRACTKERSKLVCQIYCPVDDLYHRTLYVFSCPSPSCHRTSKGWQVVRVQSPVPATKPVNGTARLLEEKPADSATSWSVVGADDWGLDDVDDWGTSAVDRDRAADADPSTYGGQATDTNLSAQTTDGVKLTDEPITAERDASGLICSFSDLSVTFSDLSVNPTDNLAYDSYYVSVVDDSRSPADKLDKQGRQFLEEYERVAAKLENHSAKGGARASSAAGEHYEKTSIAHGDKLFYKFSKAVSQNPSQIIRYNYGGKPLPMQSLDPAVVPPCQVCKAARTFELQLMPALLQNLRVGGEPSPLDVGTMIVFSCSNSCWAGNALLEYSVVQHDPDEHLFNRK